MDETEDKLKQLIADCLGFRVEELKPTANFIEDLGADSLDIVELVMAIEEEFEIEIPDDSADKVKTVSDALELVRSLKK